MTATQLEPTRDDVVKRLPPLYAAALRLHEDGLEDLEIAIHLEIPVKDVEFLVGFAKAEVRRATAGDL